VATPSTLRPLLDIAGGVDRLLPTDGLASLDWAGPAPDLAVNLHGSGPESHRILMDHSPRRLVAFACDEAGVAGPPWDPAEHETVRWCRLVSAELGVPADVGDLRLSVPEQPPLVSGAVVVHPGAAFPARRWPPERFAAVARWAVSQGRPVVLTGSVGERQLVDRVRRLAGLPEQASLAGGTDLGQLAALVADAALVVCGDTGVAHLASAFATPSVLLFGPTPPSRWGPPPSGPHTVLWRGVGGGDPFGDEPNPALLELSVTEVVQAAAGQLRTAGERPRRTTPASA
jgi:hypothetical protein